MSAPRTRSTGMSESSTPNDGTVKPRESPSGATPREADALYQNGRIVARVADTEIDLDAREIRFREVHNSDDLVIPEETEFQEYRILIQRIAYATKIQRGEEHKGRVLRGVSCDLLGYRER
jgi:hypothetical protein